MEAEGTPLWVTVVLMALSGWLSHHLTLRRERTVIAADWGAQWRKRFSDSLKDVSDAAALHYAQADEIRNTASSSCLILNSLKRLRSLMEEVKFTDPRDSKRFFDAYRYFYSVISGSEDFQDSGRTIRPATDEIFEEIRMAEVDLAKIAQQEISQHAA